MERPLPDKSGYTLLNPTPAEYMRELSADRPDKTDCPFTVDAGHFQLEMDYVNYTWDSQGEQSGIKAEAYQVAPMNLKVGVLNNLDVQLILVPWESLRVKNNNTGTVDIQSGFGDITPRVKLNLVGNNGGFFALALIPFVKIPTAQDNLGDGAYESGVGIPYAFDVPNWDVGFQTTVNINHNNIGIGNHSEIANSASVGHAIIGALEYHAEFYSSVSTEQNSDWVGTFDTWITCKLNKNLILDGGAYIGVTKGADDWHLWIGMTKRF